jgi:hypothetical protein
MWMKQTQMKELMIEYTKGIKKRGDMAELALQLLSLP